MGDVIQTLRGSTTDWWHHVLLLIVVNVVWLALSATVILLPLATAALYLITHRIMYGDTLHYRDILADVRCYLWVSVRWALVTFAAVAILYASFRGWLPRPMLCVLIPCSLIWLSFQIVLWPFLIEQPQKHLRLAVYHTILFGISAPRFVIGLLMFLIPLLVVSVMLRIPLAVFTISFVALVGSRAVHDQLAIYGWLPDQKLEG